MGDPAEYEWERKRSGTTADAEEVLWWEKQQLLTFDTGHQIPPYGIVEEDTPGAVSVGYLKTICEECDGSGVDRFEDIECGSCGGTGVCLASHETYADRALVAQFTAIRQRYGTHQNVSLRYWWYGD